MSDSQVVQPLKSRKAWIIENVVSMGSALLIVFTIRSSVIEAFKIPSGSMIPTLLVGDHIFVNKFAYGFKLPFSDLITDHSIYIIPRDQPKRGDVIVFIYPKDESLYYIKRVVGVPGDIIEMRNKVVYINQKMVSQDQVPEAIAKHTYEKLVESENAVGSAELYTEHLDAVDHPILLDQYKLHSVNFGPVTVPQASYFVMGDNRDSSGDSRFWGFVPSKNIKGKAIVIWLSFWVDFSEGLFHFRPGRTGSLIQ